MRQDAFVEFYPKLETDGFLITSYRRYEPTEMRGTIPNGKTFLFICTGSTAKLNIGVTNVETKPQWSGTQNRTDWSDPIITDQIFRELYASAPANVKR